MIEITRHDDVQRVRMWTRRSAAVGYDVSAYLVRGVLVDTGFRHVSNELERVLETLAPRGVIVTHSHEDHAGNASTLAKRLPMWMPDYTERVLRDRPSVKLYRHFTWGRPTPLRVTLTSFDVAPLRLVATPGHSPDHHVVFDAHRGLVSNPVAALNAKRSWLQETVAEIERRLDAGETHSRILRAVLGGEERTAFVSQGEYSRRNLIRTVERHRPG